MKSGTVRNLLLFVATLVTILCSRSAFAAPTSNEPKPKPPLRIVTTIQPLRGLVEPMLKDAGISADVETLIPAGVSEHGYEIPPSKLAALARADVVILAGLGMEPQVEKFLKDRPKKSRKVVLAAEAAGVKADDDADHDHAHHHHDGECNHEQDPHVWLDPVLAEKIVSAIAEALRSAIGDDADAAKKVWLAEEAQLKRVKDLHAKYERTLTKAQRKTIVVGHDAWGYLAKRYGLTTVAIKGLTASEPTPASMEAATKAIREQGAGTVFLEPQLNAQAGKRIASMTGVSISMLDPLGDGDYFKMMESNLSAIAKALGVAETKE